MGKSTDRIQDYYDIHYDEVLGEGGFARVFRATSRSSPLEVAIKRIDKDSMEAKGMLKRVKEEVRIHFQLKHPSILKLYNSFEDDKYVYMVLELCQNGDLQNYLKRTKPISLSQVKDFIRQVVEGILYLHTKQVVHRDISLANLLLTKDMNIKIADFGLAFERTRLNEKHQTMCGTPNYISPEVATSSEHGPEVDVWGVGVILFTMLVGKPPFDHDEGVRQTLNRVIQADMDIPDYVSRDGRDLLYLLLEKNPTHRIKLQSILFHPFMSQNNSFSRPWSRSSSRFTSSRKGWLSYDSGLAPSFQTETNSTPFSEPELVSAGRRPVLNGATLQKRQDPSNLSLPCCNGHLPNINRGTDCSHCNPTSESGHICHGKSFHHCHPSIPTPPINSQRLQPIRQKTKTVIVNILENGEVCLEFMKLRNGLERVNEVLRISPDGMRIVIYSPNCGRGVPPGSSPPPIPSSGPDFIYSYNEFPEKYWKKYSYASTFVRLVKTKTPKVTFYSRSAKCFLMENAPNPDFEACFYEGGKITKSGNEVKLIQSNGESFSFNSSETPSLPPSAQLMWEHFVKCRKHCERIESSLEALNSNSEDACFPVTVGRRPPQYSRHLQPSSDGNKENVSPIAPSEVNVKRIPGYESSVISASSRARSGSSTKKKVNRVLTVPTGGTVTQYTNGDLVRAYSDGSSLMLNTTGAASYTNRVGQTFQYKESDAIPEEMRIKLTEMNEIVHRLMTS